MLKQANHHFAFPKIANVGANGEDFEKREKVDGVSKPV
jgi:hypothetical protein